MRQLFRFEHRSEPLASSTQFSTRLARNVLWALAIILVALAIGMAGYWWFEGFDLINSFINAAMILSGEGPIGPLKTDGGKIFAGLFAISSTLLILGITGLVLAPVLHRLMHSFHVDESKDDE